MKFYHYRQNNSGGSFVVTESLTTNVIIEAENAHMADAKLEWLGGYFNGCDNDRDCPCCGDRWYPAYDNEGADEPRIYGSMTIDEYMNQKLGHWSDPDVIVHYSDGRVEKFGKGEENK